MIVRFSKFYLLFKSESYSTSVFKARVKLPESCSLEWIRFSMLVSYSFVCSSNCLNFSSIISFIALVFSSILPTRRLKTASAISASLSYWCAAGSTSSSAVYCTGLPSSPHDWVIFSTRANSVLSASVRISESNLSLSMSSRHLSCSYGRPTSVKTLSRSLLQMSPSAMPSMYLPFLVRHSRTVSVIWCWFLSGR